MKRLILLAFFSFSILSMSAQISEDQWTLVTKKTADWCSFCGGYGWTFKNYLLEDYEDENVVVWAAHHSGGQMTPTAKAITDNFGGSGQPIFYINNDNMGVNSGNLNAKRAEFQIFIESLNAFAPFAGVGSTATFDGEKITTTATAKFLTPLEGGDYWLSSYLVDDVLFASQASQGSNAKHQNILMHSFNGSNYFGENILTGPAETNQEFTVDGELDFSGQANIPDYADGYSIVTILWTKVNDVYTPLNLNKQAITSVVSTKEILTNVDISAFHLGAGEIKLNVTSDKNIKNATIHLFDIHGRALTSLKDRNISSGENQFMLQTQELALGTYVVVIESDQGSKSLKVLVN